MSKTRVLVVDDHEVYRAGLRTVLSAEADFEVVGEAADAQTAYAEDERAHPDLTLVDFWLPGSDGLSIVRELRRRNSERRVAMLSASATPALMLEALQAGAAGFLLKTQPVPELIAGVRTIAQGQSYVPAELEALVAQQRARLVAGGGPSHFDLLSAREKEVFRLLVRGKSNADIAHELFIGIETVETDRQRIMSKLGVHSLADLVRYAVRSQLLDR